MIVMTCRSGRPYRDAQERLLGRQDLCRTYLAHHELESVSFIIIIIIIILMSTMPPVLGGQHLGDSMWVSRLC